ncbi:MAG TPA: Panacea domain-containing protein [Candidatus Aquilonibacter sp.]|nr:Panacea domain-containing protein [Candidatus Aquilonibacter sp.]
MKFVYKPIKAAQAAAYLVRLSGGTMDVYALIKILYLADRKCLVERGRSITTDAMVSMPLGPVLSRIYDETKAPAEIQNRYWREYLTEREDNLVSLRREDCPTDELSEYERRLLRSVYEEYRHLGFTDLKSLTHSLPEYTDPQGSSLPIDPALILEQAGWSAEDIQDVRMSANEEAFARALCG